MSSTLQCAKCGVINRVSPKSGKLAVCGRCGTELVPTAPVTITDANFGEVVERSKLPALIDFWAVWCPPCKVLAPTIDALANELAGRALVGKLDVDRNPVVASRFHVQSIPTMIIFKDGAEVDRLVGAQSRGAIIRRLGFNN